MKLHQRRRLIAFILALTIGFTGVVMPAYATTNDSDIIPNNFPSTRNYRENNDSFYTADSFNSSDDRRISEDSSEAFIDGAVKGFVGTVGVVVGGAVACYTLDGIATAFFPPAAALAVLCPGLGAATGGAKAVLKAR